MRGLFQTPRPLWRGVWDLGSLPLGQYNLCGGMPPVALYTGKLGAFGENIGAPFRKPFGIPNSRVSVVRLSDQINTHHNLLLEEVPHGLVYAIVDVAHDATEVMIFNKELGQFWGGLR